MPSLHSFSAYIFMKFTSRELLKLEHGSITVLVRSTFCHDAISFCSLLVNHLIIVTHSSRLISLHTSKLHRRIVWRLFHILVKQAEESKWQILCCNLKVCNLVWHGLYQICMSRNHFFTHRWWNCWNAYRIQDVPKSVLPFYFIKGEQTRTLAWTGHGIFLTQSR